jgi:predicted dithiol-disulfide oxidoreductase (DUF899 family)
VTDVLSTEQTEVGLPVVSPAEWRASFEALLAKETALTAARDDMAAARRRMPMRRVIVCRTFHAHDVEDSPPGRPQAEPYRWWRRNDECGRS